MEQRVGAAMRAVRRRRGLRQADVAASAGVSRATVWRLERGDLGSLPFGTACRVARALGMRIDIVPRWHGGELDRLLNARHSAMHEQLARRFRSMPAWTVAPEVSYSVFGERGIIDILAWHPRRRALLVVELKTAIVDVQQLLGSMDQKRRLAARIGRERGWATADATTSVWVAVSDSRTNRARLAAHATLVRGAFPDDGRAIVGWLADPRRPLSALTFLQIASHVSTKHDSRPILHPRTGRGHGDIASPEHESAALTACADVGGPAAGRRDVHEGRLGELSAGSEAAGARHARWE